MNKYEIEYTTNIDDRKTVVVTAESKTAAYLQFIDKYPKHYAITNMKEISDRIRMRSKAGRHIVTHHGKNTYFRTLTVTLIFAKLCKEGAFNA